MTNPKVFISATTRDLQSYRTVVTDWAREKGYEPIVQDEFSVQSDYGTIVQMLREKLDPCDAVIHLAGLFYGFEPNNRPEGEAQRSYTQLEYELGREHKRQVFRFIARTDYKADNEFTQTDEQSALQEQHRQRLMQGNELYYKFSNRAELKQLLDKIEIKATLAKPVSREFNTIGSLFKGRDDFIEQLRSVLVNKPTHIAAVTAKQAIHGLGGVGKTRVAVEYAKRFSNDYTALLFITADSPSSLQRNLANLCGALVLNLPEQEAREQEVQVAATLRWLREHSGWFLIVDNVDTPEAATEVEGLLQQFDTGHVVVTSRLSQWGNAVEQLALDVISETDSQEFLLERTQGNRKPTSTDEADALSLAKDLGRLPLALEQAGAFIVKHHGSLREYSTRWKQQEAKVLKWHDPRLMKYPASVATTWQTSFDQLTDDGRGLLNVLCWLAPDPIPMTMIQKLTTVGNESPIDIESGIADLEEYSYLKWTSAQHDFVEVHGLVQEITRYRLPDSDDLPWLKRTIRNFIYGITRSHCHFVKQMDWLLVALRMVDDFVPVEPNYGDAHLWPTIYLPGQMHFAALIQRVEQFCETVTSTGPVPNVVLNIASRLRNDLAGFLKHRADFKNAEPLMRRALVVDEQSYGGLHPIVATRLNNLALLLMNTNRLSEAEPLLCRALAIVERTYGDEHPSVAVKLNNLAQLLQEMNHLSEAEPLMRRALAIDERSLGGEHPDVAIRLNNLAMLLKATNRRSEAETLMRRALEIDERWYGNEHPYVARDLNNLSSLFIANNQLEQAELLIRRALAIDEGSYGDEHPKISIRLNSLAQLLLAKNRLPEAEPLMRKALAIAERSYGTEHPSVAVKLNSLAQLLQATNRLPEAEPLLRRAIAIDKQSYGSEHPSVARDLSNLGILLQATNRLSEAESVMRRALAIDIQSFGTEHPNVARDLKNLGLLLLATSRLAEAEPLIRRALAINEQSYGTEHPKVARDLNSLAQLFYSTNRFVESEMLSRRAIAIDEQSYGTEHPEVARDLINLAQLLEATNRLAEAEPLSWRSVLIFIAFGKSTGHEHPQMQTALRNHQFLLQTMGLSEFEAVANIQSKLKGEAV